MNTQWRRFFNLRSLLIFSVLSLAVMGWFANQAGGPDQTPLEWAVTTIGLTALAVGGGVLLMAALAVTGQGGPAVGQAQQLARQGRTNAALDRYNAALARRPDQAEALVGRAGVLVEQDQLLAALDDLNHAITHTPHVRNFTDPILVQAYLERGRVREWLGDRQGALDDWEQATQAAPGQPEPYLMRGRVELEQGHYYQGEAEVKRAIKLASVYLGQARQDRAAQAAMLNLRGVGYSLLEQHRPALADLEAALALEPNAWAVQLNLARVYLAMGHRDPALAAVEQALRLHPPAAALARRSSAFRALQDDPAFERLLMRARSEPGAGG
jgi:tetratricopeptide (TPR) repeat protein